jgi:hypothetical protein
MATAFPRGSLRAALLVPKSGKYTARTDVKPGDSLQIPPRPTTSYSVE